MNIDIEALAGEIVDRIDGNAYFTTAQNQALRPVIADILRTALQSAGKAGDVVEVDVSRMVEDIITRTLARYKIIEDPCGIGNIAHHAAMLKLACLYMKGSPAPQDQEQPPFPSSHDGPELP